MDARELDAASNFNRTFGVVDSCVKQGVGDEVRLSRVETTTTIVVVAASHKASSRCSTHGGPVKVSRLEIIRRK